MCKQVEEKIMLKYSHNKKKMELVIDKQQIIEGSLYFYTTRKKGSSTASMKKRKGNAGISVYFGGVVICPTVSLPFPTLRCKGEKHTEKMF